MESTKLLQISSLGSADKNNLSIFSEVEKPERMLDWDSSPNNPIIQNFQNLFNTPSKEFDNPGFQNLLFDADNGVKGQAGIYRTMQDGLTSFGSDIDGKPLYAFNDMANNQSYDLGKNRLYTAGTMMQAFGAFSDEEEADKFAAFTENAGDPKFMGAISGLSATGDKKGAVNLIMKEFGYPELDSLETYDDKKRAYGTAFAAYNYVENAEKMSPAQQSMTLSTIGMMSYKFKDGTTMQDRALVKGADGKTEFSLGEAFNLGGTGADVFSMQKNWDQLSAMQKITYGSGTPSQLAATGKRMQLLGDPSMGGSAVMQTEAELGRSGFTSVPSAGMGAITGNADALPQNYEVIGAGAKPNQVIAVPKGLSYSAGTINGTTEIRSLNNADGIKPASIGAFKTYANQLPNKSSNNLRGTSFGTGIGQSGALQDPYLKSAIVTTSVYGNTVNKKQSEVSNADIVKAGTKLAAKGGGASALVGSFGGGAGVLLADGSIVAEGSAAAEVATAAGTAVGSAAMPASGVLGALGPVGVGVLGVGAAYMIGKQFEGGKSAPQQGRDAVRKLGTESGLVNKDWSVALSDGSTADIGTDGHGGQHEFRFKEKDPNNIGRSLNAYDVDYTNDLDFSSNMMTSALMRMMAGGKGVPIDQIAGQFANAALGKVGYGQDMTEENFNYVRDNVRGFYFKQGIQTKEDAYALSNQMFSEGRITEMDSIAMQQGINMVFDDNGFDTANTLMAGRWKGLEVAADMPSSPGPNYNVSTKFPSKEQIDSVDSLPPAPKSELEMNPGTYGGNKNTDIFTKSIIKYKDPKRMKRG